MQKIVTAQLKEFWRKLLFDRLILLTITNNIAPSDVQIMLAEVDNIGSLNSLPLGQNDVPNYFLLSQKLHGRTAEKKELFEVFDRTCGGSFEILFIIGDSGIGKSSLAHEICTPVVQKKGFFIKGESSSQFVTFVIKLKCLIYKGKYDQVRQEPYSGLLEAFNNFFDVLLNEGGEVFNFFRKAILDSVGDQGSILTDVWPVLKRIIGTQRSTDEIVGYEAKNRFQSMFRILMRSICSERYPIIVLLDDLHWADEDSLDLLLTLVTDRMIKNFLLIGTYRDEEAETDDHRLNLALTEMKDIIKIPSSRIELGPLENEEINNHLSETLGKSPFQTFPLTVYVKKKTDGNPLHIALYLEYLVNEEYLFFSASENKWRWKDLDLKSEYNTVTNLIVKKIMNLDSETQNIIKVASCVGYKFSVATLKLIEDKLTGLEDAVDEGIFIASSNGKKKYRFAHDAFLEAAKTLIPNEDRPSTHLSIARLLKGKIPSDKMGEDENIFVVVKLMNSVLDLVQDPAERVEIARLNLSGGIKAMSLTAFKPAFEYLTVGISILGTGYWTKDYALTLELYNATAKAAYCSKDPLSLQSLTVSIFGCANNLQDKMHSYALHIQVLYDTKKYQEMINVGFNILAQLGEQFPINPSLDFVKQRLLEISSRITEANFNNISLRTMENDYISMYKMKMFSLVYKAAYFAMPVYLSLIGIRMVELTLTAGTSKYSGIGFAILASELCSYEKMQEGYNCARVALRLTKMCSSKEISPSVTLNVYRNVIYWAEHLHLTFDSLLLAARTALETGCNELSYLNYSMYCHGMLASGGPLNKVEETLNEFDGILRVKRKTHLFVHQALITYLGRPGVENSTFLTGDLFNIRDFELEDEAECALIYVQCIMLAFYFHEYEKAMEYIEICRHYIHHIDREFTKIYFIFYDGMTNLALAVKNNRREGKWKDDVKGCISQIRRSAEISPINFLNKLRILEAGLEAFETHYAQATSLYKEAIILSKAHNFTNEEALALEQVGSLYFRSGELADAAVMLNEAHKTYARWGAHAKLSHLEGLYPEITFESVGETAQVVINVTNNSCTESEISSLSRYSSIFSQNTDRSSKKVRFSK